ncbi:MAG: hypothetical protein HOP29_18620, partial [Phycisphaerales bacterium]|nr:hypothetical protein [Phycisphaerales bacterium]
MRRNVLDRCVADLAAMLVFAIAGVVVGGATVRGDGGDVGSSRAARVFGTVVEAEDGTSAQVAIEADGFQDLVTGAARRVLELPIPGSAAVSLEMERFSVTNGATRFLVQTRDGVRQLPAPDVVLMRGRVAGETGSRVFLSVSAGGRVNGSIQRANGEEFFVA